MENIISIKNLSFSYGEKEIFKKFDLNIKKGSFTSLIGPSGSGKSTLIKLILGIVKTNDYISVNGKPVIDANLKEVRKSVGVVFQNLDNQIVAETVMDEIAFSLENLNFDRKSIEKKILKVSEMLDINDILEEEPHALSAEKKQLVALASVLAISPPIIILDSGLNKLDSMDRDRVLRILRDLHKNNKTTIIHVTNDIEDVLFGDEIILINNGMLSIQGKTGEVLKRKDIFDRAHMNRPFVVELSERLKFYGVVNEIFYSMNKLVNAVWK
jgi:energy-coupling factor transport system ATP-binding protein